MEKQVTDVEVLLALNDTSSSSDARRHSWDGATRESTQGTSDDSGGQCDGEDADDSLHDSHSGQGSTEDASRPFGKRRAIAGDEARALRSIKAAVVFVLLCLSALLAAGVYFYTHSSEEREFDVQFDEYANKILEDVGSILDDTLKALDLLATAVASKAQNMVGDNAHPWPRVTVPDFALHAAKTISLSKIKALVMCVVVTPETRTEWEAYTTTTGREWVDKTIDVLETDPNYYGPINREYYVNPSIHGHLGSVRSNETDYFFPSWQAYPVVPRWPPYNFDYLYLDYTDAHRRMITNNMVVITEPYMLPDPNDEEQVQEAEDWASWYKDRISPDEEPMEPASEIYFPIFNSTDTIRVDADLTPVAGFASSFYWRDMLRAIIPDGAPSMVVVTRNPCSPTFTYEINGPDVRYLGRGDHHDTRYDGMAVSSNIADLETFRIQNASYTGPAFDYEYCPNTFVIYPTRDMEDRFLSNNPILFTVVAILICMLTSLTFVLYDVFVERRQRAVMATAEKSDAVVSSLFPEGVRDRLYNEASADADDRNNSRLPVARSANQKSGNIVPPEPQGAMRGSSKHDTASVARAGKPIAELYPSTTVMFADIVGFTSWSATRQPEAVFILLEAIYGAFDSSARKRRVFKVETIGDCYVAVCGLPKPREHHALVMVRFALECRSTMNSLMKRLAGQLGPSTADLKMRFGLNSGPTTAGVIRGDRSRFQLFGDTVNTAARMESTGMTDRIHISPKTADLLADAGKSSWVVPREDVVVAKGKGAIQTFWVEVPGNIDAGYSVQSGGFSDGYSTVSDDNEHSKSDDGNGDSGNETDGIRRRSVRKTKVSKADRLIEWNTKMLDGLLRQVVAFNGRALAKDGAKGTTQQLSGAAPITMPVTRVVANPQPRQEAGEPVPFVTCEGRTASGSSDDDGAFDVRSGSAAIDDAKNAGDLPPLAPALYNELRELVSSVAYTHKADNPFHNFDHATQVVMSTLKLFKRMEGTPQHAHCSSSSSNVNIDGARFARLFKADPVIQFAAVFASLVHDLDHPGVPNHVLVREQSRLASLYNGQSVAEQNSTNMGWDLLVSDLFPTLQGCLFFGSGEADNVSRQRLVRGIMVRAIIATDIFDKELSQSRELRWQAGFANASVPAGGRIDVEGGDTNERMTSILEHLIQVSDVSHTMQHWTIFVKWNGRLFREVRRNYRAGRTEHDPADGWYQGELWFFDNYVIPLVHKLKECGVYETGWCEEALKYATGNRSEWERKGQSLVKRWTEEDNRESTDGSSSG